MAITVLALDLERTLVSDAFSAEPRPGLRAFLDFCDAGFGRVTLFTCVDEADAREVMSDLVASGHAPAEFVARLEYVSWVGEYKDLAFVPAAAPADIVLVDDDGGWIIPEQRGQWLEIEGWDGGPDNELAHVRVALEGWLAGRSPRPTAE